jgi:hypothetical protein
MFHSFFVHVGGETPLERTKNLLAYSEWTISQQNT